MEHSMILTRFSSLTRAGIRLVPTLEGLISFRNSLQLVQIQQANGATNGWVQSIGCSRKLSRFLSTSKEEGPDHEISTYLAETHRIDSQLHDGILKALQSVYGKEMKLSQVEAFGKAGLMALSEAVEADRNRKRSAKIRPSKLVTFTIPHHSTTFQLKWRQGQSVLDVAKSAAGEELLGEYMEGTCGGQMSCCTCHVYLDEKTFTVLPPPCEAELDMLDLAFEPCETSRLGCQVFLKNGLLETDHEIVVTIPADVNNVWK
jgi:ferredoxin